MRRNWLIILALVMAAAALAAERATARYYQKLRAARQALQQEVAEAEVRSQRAAVEKDDYLAMQQIARTVTAQVRWEPDTTRLLKWFTDTAADLGLHQSSCRLLAADAAAAPLAGGAFQSVRFEANLKGAYWPLASYVDRVEHAATPMLIESLALTADRDKAGAGELKLTVACLQPTAGKGANAQAGAKP